MLNVKHSFIEPALIAYLSMTPIQVKTPLKPQIVAQLPPGAAEERVFSSPYIENQYNQNQYNQNGANYGLYKVIVDSPYSGLLQQVRRVQPGAIIKSHRGRSVIQVGSFRSLNNAQNMVRRLQENGINARMVNENGGMGIPNYPNPNGNLIDSNYPNYPIGNNSRQKTKYYYVAIPSKRDKLFQIENQIRQNMGRYLQYNQVIRRNSPRGPHVAVGPFGDRSQAQEWKKYLRSLGLKNARVYYGK